MIIAFNLKGWKNRAKMSTIKIYILIILTLSIDKLLNSGRMSRYKVSKKSDILDIIPKKF